MRYIVLEVLHMYKTFGETIASLRRAHGMRQQALAEAMAEAGMPVSNQAVSKWENDATLPNAQQFLTLCRVLDVDDIAGTFSGGDAGGLLAGLNAEGRRRALEYIALLRESKRFAAVPEVPALRSLPLYSLAVSAGTGQFLDGESYEMQPVGPEVPEEANFGVRVAGDSMEPRFHDGQTVWVRQQRSLMTGRHSPPARSACFSTTATPISSSCGATEGASGCTRSTRPTTIWRSRTPFPCACSEKPCPDKKAEKLPAGSDPAGSFRIMPRSSAAAARPALRRSAPLPPLRRPPARPALHSRNTRRGTAHRRQRRR